MKKTLLSFVFIFSVLFSFGQSLADTAKYFDVLTIDNERFSLEEFWNENPLKKVAIEFYYSDSPLCKETSPVIDSVYKKFGSNQGEKDIRHYPTDTIYTYGADSAITDTLIIPESNRNIILQDIWPLPNADSLFKLLDYHLNDATGIEEFEKSKSSQFTIYPNPANDQISILPSNTEGLFDIDILDISGKLLGTQRKILSLSAPQYISISDLKRGLYIVRIRNEKGYWSKKLIIE